MGDKLKDEASKREIFSQFWYKQSNLFESFIRMYAFGFTQCACYDCILVLYPFIILYSYVSEKDNRR